MRPIRRLRYYARSIFVALAGFSNPIAIALHDVMRELKCDQLIRMHAGKERDGWRRRLEVDHV